MTYIRVEAVSFGCTERGMLVKRGRKIRSKDFVIWFVKMAAALKLSIPRRKKDD
jgi:hypothetical protein